MFHCFASVLLSATAKRFSLCCMQNFFDFSFGKLKISVFQNLCYFLNMFWESVTFLNPIYSMFCWFVAICLLQPFSTIFNRFQLFSTVFSSFQPFSLVFNRFLRFSTVLHQCYYPQPPRDSVSPVCRIFQI